jgi:hypothetical protein
MIVKFLSNKSGGGIGSINYLLDTKRVNNGTARVIKGDERMTRDLINTITKKQKTTFGVMSFEEQNIPEAQKYELIEQFEKTFFAGLRPDQYNILWVEHTDKGRLELNCIIPKVELSTGKAFNPYYHGSDLHIKDLFTKSVNLKYNFTDPQDPSKSASVSGSKKQIGLFKDYEELDKKLKFLVAQGAIQDRAELIDLLKENGIEVTRQGEDYISVKLPESKKARRFNGGIYKKQFTSVDELRDIRADSTQRERAFTGRDRQAEYREVDKRLGDAVAKRAQYNAAIYREPKKRERATAERVAERTRELKIVPTENGRSSQQRPREIEETRKPIPVGSNQRNLELEHDRIRSAITQYVKSREERSRARAQRISFYAGVNQQTTATNYRVIAEARRVRQLRNYVAKSLRQLPRIFDRVAHSIAETIKELTTKPKPIDRELEEIRAIFGRNDANDKEQPTRSSGLFMSR